ncbi:aldehyde dehydrogenase (NAD+) [Rhodobacter aestuarii]|uniref:Aldehyde dehydrogenase (NAD+) n=1 Tax=Rhodobacter aestuarii TaxID=453582 RepID=A0A1N7NES6_9RHOB|nr:aldehyde dehydrogenase family protein [Rhodobacter aestuarii]PTV96420.1 aldehyde dehydrogenase (NAD+) [Rhodobacter aestuarii]SIS96854.1 aldehyde dehydrogenase (NAD+) [Rhodobacter aestuarii]
MPSVTEILEMMDYGAAPVSDRPAQDWLKAHSPLGHFIGGAFTEAANGQALPYPATGKELAQVAEGSADDVTRAVASARAAAPGWAALPPHERAEHLTKLAALLRKRQEVLAQLATRESGRAIHTTTATDVPEAIAQFTHFAHRAELLDETFPGRAPHGIVGIILPVQRAFVTLAAKVAPALAAGNTLVLKPAAEAPLTALAFAAICAEAGLPAGVINVVTGGAELDQTLAEAEIEMLSFTGPTEAGRALRIATAGSGKALALALGGRPPHLIFADADLDAAVEGVVTALESSPRLLVAEAVLERFTQKLTRRLETLRIGDPLDKGTDLGITVPPSHLAEIRARIAQGVEAGAELVQPNLSVHLPKNGQFCRPGLLLHVFPANPCFDAETLGPTTTLTSFRTPAEAVELANNSRFGRAAAVWSENITLATDIAAQIETGTVWINSSDLSAPGAPQEGLRESGVSQAGLAAYLAPSTVPALPEPPAVMIPESVLGESDVAKAVAQAEKAGGWSQKTGADRAQVLRAFSAELAVQQARIAERLQSLGHDPQEAAQAIRLAYRCAAHAETGADEALRPAPKTLALAQSLPWGVLGVACPVTQPLLGFAALVLPALAMGNRVVAISAPSLAQILPDLAQMLTKAGVPGGVLSLVNGPRDTWVQTLARHDGVAALWYAGNAEGAALAERQSAGNLKATWCPTERDWSAQPLSETLAQARQSKTIWLPYGA